MINLIIFHFKIFNFKNDSNVKKVESKQLIEKV